MKSVVESDYLIGKRTAFEAVRVVGLKVVERGSDTIVHSIYCYLCDCWNCWNCFCLG